jgi:hypothetical protein
MLHVQSIPLYKSHDIHTKTVHLNLILFHFYGIEIRIIHMIFLYSWNSKLTKSSVLAAALILYTWTYPSDIKFVVIPSLSNVRLVSLNWPFF